MRNQFSGEGAFYMDFLENIWSITLKVVTVTVPVQNSNEDFFLAPFSR